MPTYRLWYALPAPRHFSFGFLDGIFVGVLGVGAEAKGMMGEEVVGNSELMILGNLCVMDFSRDGTLLGVIWKR